jgi:hypothetical protein
MWNNDFDIGAYDRQHMEALREEADRERLARQCQPERRSLLQTVLEAAGHLIQR